MVSLLPDLVEAVAPRQYLPVVIVVPSRVFVITPPFSLNHLSIYLSICSSFFLVGGGRPNCAWQVATEPSASSFGYLDLNAFYHTMVLSDFHDEDVYRISGTFPSMR